MTVNKHMEGFPGGAVVESLPANAGDTGSGPGLGGSHMLRSDWACEPRLLSLRIWSLCSAKREAAIVGGPRTAIKSGPHLPQLGKALARKRRPNTAKNKLNLKKKKKKKHMERSSIALVIRKIQIKTIKRIKLSVQNRKDAILYSL